MGRHPVQVYDERPTLPKSGVDKFLGASQQQVFSLRWISTRMLQPPPDWGGPVNSWPETHSGNHDAVGRVFRTIWTVLAVSTPSRS